MLFSSDYDLIITLITFGVLIVSLPLHEYGHAVTALWNGDDTAKRAGRLTINPIAHFDLMGLMMILFMPFGYAKPVPVNPNNFRRLKRGILMVALGGVTMNLIIAFVSMGILVPVVNYAPDFVNNTVAGDIVWMFLSMFVTVNLCLIAFNILPVFPLDGFRVVESFTRYSNPYCKWMRKNGQYLIIGLVLWSVVIQLVTSRINAPFLNYFDVLGHWINFIAEGLMWPIQKFWELILVH